ncbi:hypothetical protein BDP81DRAFT_475273 [Colletotrichum phormii]|uniref:Uncharacterized protein n=1 Tax=Colletotrichum phormii TaxID=359342 RepID=A0AAJ0EBT2_9PEZI|nr:uncharacterized protein BDP81DRAFT_475273 [Colletotrichum phormii]KAK1623957.1 hypothetical protein BDP81DRAFT_475273 [Colletotrichum phormii]
MADRPVRTFQMYLSLQDFNPQQPPLPTSKGPKLPSAPLAGANEGIPRDEKKPPQLPRYPNAHQAQLDYGTQSRPSSLLVSIFEPQGRLSRCHTGLTLYDVGGPPQLRADPLVPQAGPRTINRNPAAAAGEAGGEGTSDDRAARGPFFPVFRNAAHAATERVPASHIPTRYGYTTYTNPPLRNGGESGTKRIAICPPTRIHPGPMDKDTDPV